MSHRLRRMAWSMALPFALSAVSASNAADAQLEQAAAAFHRGAVEEAATRWAAAARSYEQRGEVGGRVAALTQLARAQSELGQYAQAAVSLRTALELAQAQGDRQRVAAIGAPLGNVYIALGP